MKQRKKILNGKQRRGAVVVMVVAMLMLVFGLAALAVDVGYICALTAEQQNTADASSLAGAIALQDKESQFVLERVFDVIARNQKPQGYLSLEDQIVEIGIWNSVTHTFTPLDPIDWERGAFAVRVRAARNRAPLFFAAIAGHHQTNVRREAVAVGSRSCGGIWGLEGVRVPGNVRTDSYDSRVRSYQPDTAGTNGDICSGRHVDVLGSFDVQGDIMTGLGYDLRVAGGAGNITGITTSSLDGIVGPPVDFGDVEFNNDNATIGKTDQQRDPLADGLNLVLRSNETLVLNGGTYYFDSITMRSGAAIRLTGPTKIYVSGDVDSGDVDATGRGFVNLTKDPKNFDLISLGSRVRLNGSSTFYGSMLAPKADLILSGDSNVYGAAVARTVTMRGNFQFHVDESLPLSNWQTPPPPMLVK